MRVAPTLSSADAENPILGLAGRSTDILRSMGVRASRVVSAATMSIGVGPLIFVIVANGVVCVYQCLTSWIDKK
jgi:hypothetical protein